MIPTKRLHSPVFIGAAGILLLIGAGLLLSQTTTIPFPSNNIVIGTTIFPLADIAQHIAGNEATVVQLIPSGASPHSYSFTPQNIGQLQNAKTLFVIGHGLDDWSARPAAQSVDVPVVSVDTNIDLHEFGEHHEDHEEEGEEHEAGSIDPHYWLTVPNAKIIAANVAATLSKLDPEHADAYEENLADYIKQLDDAETTLQQKAAGASQRHFIAMHDAWSYFSEQYGFELVGTYEPVEGREPSITDLQHLQELVEEYGITTFYAEPQKQSSAATQFLSEEFGLTIKVLDAEGGGSPDKNSYIELMQYNMDQLVQ